MKWDKDLVRHMRGPLDHKRHEEIADVFIESLKREATIMYNEAKIANLHRLFGKPNA